ncbi:hypothetical protein FLAG1_05945 [Fusarium langsethiae]|uniref:Uncharacterized protein n=1 Tax=Fusarium langsethiae TaxID=179993 RepID=A0A0M9EWX2_FUSLA|nr:hypothetical protein FLAG1_05945 [Fusarium langsethiae]GKU03549.1 unnamed protein product [Fusarium langsethiae]GKU17596.1 unnamed protein product [Fusarium langsethiae]
MRDNDPVQGFGLTCPSGSTFYVCKNDPNRFIGCCDINPCGARKGLCPDQHLHKAGFDEAYEEYIPPQACTNDNVDVAWHACSWSTSSFMGCCAVDPCSGGCPSRELRAAKLSDNAKNTQVFLGGGYEYPPEPSPTPKSSMDPVTSTSISSTTSITTATISSFITSYTLDTTSEADTSTAEPAAPSIESPGHSKNHRCLSDGGIAGIVIAIIILIVSALCWYWNRRSHKNREKGDLHPTKFRESTPSLDGEKSSTFKDGGVQQKDQSKTLWTPDQTKHHQAQQMLFPNTPHLHNIDQLKSPAWTQQKPEVARQSQLLQVPAMPKPSRSPPPRRDEAVYELQQPPEFSNSNIPRKPVPGHDAEQRERTPTPVSPSSTAPPPSLGPSNIGTDTGTPHSSYSLVLGIVETTNGYASNRSSDASKIGTVPNRAVELPGSTPSLAI